jgi:hypothetical protein
MTKKTTIALSLMLLLTACEGPEGNGIALTPKAGNGPTVLFDLAAKPLPEIPLPNNVATRYDPASPTGRRINVSEEASTVAEQKLRHKINQLDGFGTFQPLTVSFDSPLDLEDLRARQATNHDFTDDAILLLDVDPDSPDFGRATPLDCGQGNYPLGLEWAQQYWDMDEHADSPNLLFETHDEDLNGNGKLDPYEDIDFDGVLDRPNTFSGNPIFPLVTADVPGLLKSTSRPIDDLVTFYEVETDTLVLWPVVPLREQTTYAVVLTKNMVGEEGSPVRSPFPNVNHLSQNEDLAPLKAILARTEYRFDLTDVAFAWSFTTQSVTAEMEAIRAGLYGHGHLASLQQEYAPDMEPKPVNAPKEDGSLLDDTYVLYAADLDLLFGFAELLLGYAPEVVTALQHDVKYVDYFVLGSFTTPYFLADQDGIATPLYPADDNESFLIDLEGDGTVHGPNSVSFICAIPKETAEHKQPFPMMHYGHGYSGAPFEILGFAGRFAQYGYALCGLDALGHGLALPSDEDVNYDELVPTLLEPLGLSTFYNGFAFGRIRDLDNDGRRTSFDNGGDFWSYDIFHTRDCVRQAAIDIMQFVRVLRSLGEITWETDTNLNGKADDLMGDFNGDGVVDFGGPDNVDYPQWGQSMGAIVSELLAGAEATTTTATPISGAGGLIQVGIRTTNPGVPEAVWLPMMGPFVIFSPTSFKPIKGVGWDPETDEEPSDEHSLEMELAIMINDQHREDRPWQSPRPHYYPFVRTKKIKPGDRVIVRNKVNGEEVTAFRHLDGRGFRVSIPADGLTAVEKRPLLGLQDGDTQPVPVSCAPGSWSVELDPESEKPVGPASCDDGDLSRALLFGDALEVVVLDGWEGAEKERFDTFEMAVEYQGAIFPEGAPLVALNTGLGRARNTPGLRKLMGFASMILARGDPLSYARHYGPEERLDFSYDEGAAKQSNVIIYHTVGDPNTPIATSLALARAAGILDYQPSSGTALTTKNDALLEGYVAEGTEWSWRHLSATLTTTDWAEKSGVQVNDGRWLNEFTALFEEDPEHAIPVHADPDDLDAGTDEYGEPNLGEPVRATLRWTTKGGANIDADATGEMKASGGFSALRMPYISPMGAHGVEPSNPSRQFDINSFVENQIGLFAASQGKHFSDDPCLATSTCDFLPASVQQIGAELYGDE